MYREHLALSNLQWLICCRTKPNKKNWITSQLLELVNNIGWCVGLTKYNI